PRSAPRACPRRGGGARVTDVLASCGGAATVDRALPGGLGADVERPPPCSFENAVGDGGSGCHPTRPGAAQDRARRSARGEADCRRVHVPQVVQPIRGLQQPGVARALVDGETELTKEVDDIEHPGSPHKVNDSFRTIACLTQRRYKGYGGSAACASSPISSMYAAKISERSASTRV